MKLRGRRLGITMRQFEGARDNSLLDCAEKFKKGENIRVCEWAVNSVFDAIATTVQGGIRPIISVAVHETMKDCGIVKTYTGRAACRKGAQIAAKRLAKVL